MLEALAHPARAEILHILRRPRILADIRVHAEGGDGRKRPLARQTVRAHLDRLLAIGLVRSRTAVSTRGPTSEYVVDHRTIFALSESIREMATARPTEVMEAKTQALSGSPGSLRPETPHLLVAKGVEEGRRYPLTSQNPHASWLVGRSDDADIVLDYDPFVSHRHALLTDAADGWLLRDLGSANGTAVNFTGIEPDGQHPLAHGDVLSFGRSILVFHSQPSPVHPAAETLPVRLVRR